MISILNFDDNECFKWFLVRYLNPTDHNPRRITKVDKLFGDELDFEDTNFPVKIKDIHKIDKKNSIGVSVFGYENKVKHSVYVSKNALKENILIYY